MLWLDCMTFENLELATVLVFIMAGFLLLQAALIVGFVQRLKQEVDSLQPLLSAYSKKALEACGYIKEVLQPLDVIGEKLPEIEETVSQFLAAVSRGIAQADQKCEEGFHNVHEKIHESARKFEARLVQLNRQAAQVNRLARKPSIEASALLHAGATLLKRLLNRDRKGGRPATHAPDGQDFI